MIIKFQLSKRFTITNFMNIIININTFYNFMQIITSLHRQSIPGIQDANDSAKLYLLIF